ncbi:g8165 [Coccomyxa elongata]
MGLFQSSNASAGTSEDWKSRIVTRPKQAIEIAGEARRVAVLGIAPETKADRPAHYVAKTLQAAGVKILPVPVYYPDVQMILGEKVYRKLKDIPEPVDIVDVFRRAEDLAGHLDDILHVKPKVVWLQSGISERHFEEELAKAGITVVPDRCLMVDHEHATAKL